MEKIIERLIEKHLMKDITRITLAVYKDKFDEVFKESCEAKADSNTTLGRTFKKLYELALIEVVDFMGNHLEDINLTRAMSKGNPFYDVLWDFWYDAKDYFYFNDYITSILDDEWQEKQEELTKAGILDEHGDYIKGE